MYNKLFKYKLRLLSPMYKYFFSNLFAYSENKNNKIKSIIKYQDEKDLIDRIISNKNEYDKLNFDYLKESSVEKINYEKKENFFETVMNCDLNNYLTDDILVKVDRASMINSLETRAPFLNKNVYIFSKKLKDDEKIKYFKGKFFLRKILKKYLPNDLISSQKKGFSYPISNFFNNTKNEKWIKNALFVNSNQKVNLLSNENISQIFDLHRKKNVDYSKVLWSNLVLRLWLKRKGFIH